MTSSANASLPFDRSPTSTMDEFVANIQRDAYMKARTYAPQALLKERNSQPWASRTDVLAQPNLPTGYTSANTPSRAQTECIPRTRKVEHYPKCMSVIADSGFVSQGTVTGQGSVNEWQPMLSSITTTHPLDMAGVMHQTQLSTSGNTSSRTRAPKQGGREGPPGLQPCGNSDEGNNMKHGKLFVCVLSGCKGHAFGTNNDLQRHIWSVHKSDPTIGPKDSFMCAVCVKNSLTPPRVCRRKDNFKAHIKRKHPEWDVEQLVIQSTVIQPPEDAMAVAASHIHDYDACTSYLGSNEELGDQYLFTSVSASEDPQCSANPYARFQERTQDNGDHVLGGMQGHTANILTSFADVPARTYYPNSFDDPLNMSQAYPGAPNGNVLVGTDLYQEGGPSFVPVKRRRVGEYTVRSAAPTEQSSAIPSPAARRASSHKQQPYAQPAFEAVYQCLRCPAKKQRECDLKKHMKRHTRPYGCTSSNCFKHFGSRGDWKRHEATRHRFEESWKCCRPRADGFMCKRRPFSSRVAFENHLKNSTHYVTDAHEIERECNASHMGLNGAIRFWCGFCEALIEQDPEDLTKNPWVGRFRHIGNHFDIDGLTIGEWKRVEDHKRKSLTQSGNERPIDEDASDLEEPQDLHFDQAPPQSQIQAMETFHYSEDEILEGAHLLAWPTSV